MNRMTLVRNKLIWLILIGAILAFMAIRSGGLAARPPLELNGEPTLLFINNDRGCDCVLAIYLRADQQIAAWPAESRHSVSLHRIHLEQRPDLGWQYRIIRAPTLLLLDAAGNEIWRQDEVTSDWRIFDLEAAEAQIVVLQGDGDDG